MKEDSTGFRRQWAFPASDFSEPGKPSQKWKAKSAATPAFRKRRISILRHCWMGLFLMIGLAVGCGRSGGNGAEAVPLEPPRGYVATLEVEQDGRVFTVGPFMGYYFRPENPSDLSRLEFVAFNEKSWYTTDLPENAKLYEGEAVLARLPDAGVTLPAENRINPIFFDDAPAAWLATRPEPKAEFRHFHSGYDATGPVRFGYWIRHVAVAEFTYDMGGRVGPDSPLYHVVKPGVDTDFAEIVEFDRGPEKN